MIVAQQKGGQPLSLFSRLHIYAIHGLFTEIFFTAAWELIANRNLKVPGVSSVWAYLIYGTSMLVMENVYLALQSTTSIWRRGVLYLAWTYFWEFSCGFILKQLNACPWDYEPWFNNHFMGLVTLEYLPLWYMLNIVGEIVVIRKVLQVRFELTALSQD